MVGVEKTSDGQTELEPERFHSHPSIIYGFSRRRNLSSGMKRSMVGDIDDEKSPT
jgi:hypothetical protein